MLFENQSNIEELLKEITTSLQNIERMVIKKEKPFLNINEASEYLSIPKNTLYQYTSNNQIPYYKQGKKVFFSIEELDNFILNKSNRFMSKKEMCRKDIFK